MMKVLVTGAAGFIGYHVSQALLARGDEVVGLDNLNDYYSVDLKKARLEQLNQSKHFKFSQLDLSDREAIPALFAEEKFHRVVHLAAQAGVRHSLTHPFAYLDSNMVGFGNILEGCRQNQVEHLVYASSSSVYGANTTMPFAVENNVDHPLSLYAATKKANELMAHSYSHLYGLPTTGLRFFTVYGPWGRPDMAMFIFTRSILSGKPIQIFNHGNMKRDMTYIDDIVEGVTRTLDHTATRDLTWSPLKPNPSTSNAPYRIYNIGNNQPVQLMTLIGLLEKRLGKEAIKEFKEMQPGDVPESFADVDALVRDVGFRPSTPIDIGVNRFLDWYLDYYKS